MVDSISHIPNSDISFDGVTASKRSINELSKEQKLQVLAYLQDAITKGATCIIMDGRVHESM